MNVGTGGYGACMSSRSGSEFGTIGERTARMNTWKPIPGGRHVWIRNGEHECAGLLLGWTRTPGGQWSGRVVSADPDG